MNALSSLPPSPLQRSLFPLGLVISLIFLAYLELQSVLLYENALRGPAPHDPIVLMDNGHAFLASWDPGHKDFAWMKKHYNRVIYQKYISGTFKFVDDTAFVQCGFAPGTILVEMHRGSGFGISDLVHTGPDISVLQVDQMGLLGHV